MAALVARGEVPAIELVSRCACGALLPRPVPAGLARCGGCLAEESRADDTRQRLARVPPEFRWADIGQPLVPPGGDGGPVVTEEGRAAARAWLDADKRALTIVGWESGTGKTTLAGAIACSWAAAGLAFDWMHATELDWTNSDHEAALRRALQAPRLVLDGIGQDLGTARGETGVASQRLPGVQRFVLEMHQGRGPQRVVMTVDLTKEELKTYGGGFVRRIAANSNVVQVVKLNRAKAPDYVRF
jgi:hypothetical protein